MTKPKFDPYDVFLADGEIPQRASVFWMDPWLGGFGDEFERLMAEVENRVRVALPAQRWRATRTTLLRCIVANLVMNYGRNTARRTAYSRSRKTTAGDSRYRPSFFSARVVAGLVDGLVKAELADNKRGQWLVFGDSTTSTVKATAKLIDLCREYGVGANLTAPTEDAPTVILRLPKAQQTRGKSKRVEPPDEEPSKSTYRWLEQRMRRVNRMLATAEITLDGQMPTNRAPEDRWWDFDGGCWINSKGREINPFNRSMVRVFNNVQPENVAFDQGGRLYGGWWQGLSKLDRSRIRIDGHASRQVFLRLRLYFPQEDCHLDKALKALCNACRA